MKRNGIDTTETRGHGEVRHAAPCPRLCLRATGVGTARRGFSLIEMLVVLAVAAILLGLIVTPLVTTFNFTNQARRNVEVQDAARYATELMTREIADAMGVAVSPGDTLPFLFYTGGAPGKGEAVVVRSSGFVSAFDNTGKAWDLRNAMIDIVLPHDSLNMEGQGILQPLVPQYVNQKDGTQHPIIVRYFVGLTHPNRTNPPMWQNTQVLGISRQPNLYTVYRVEFDPYDARFSNWILPTTETDPDGRKVYRINPDFFYNTEMVKASGQNLSQAEWWRRKAVALMPTDTMDLVDFVLKDPNSRWNASGNPVVEARSLVSFDPLIMAADAAAAPDNQRRPSTYKTQYGHWTGLQNDGTISADRFAGGIAGFLPRIQVLQQDRDQDGNITLAPEFDSASTNASDQANPASRNRVLAWNSLKGTVEFSLPAPDFENTNGGDGGPSIYNPLSTLNPSVPHAYVTPGSEAVTVWEDDPNNPGVADRRRPVVYSRAASDTKDVYEVPEEIAVQNGMPQQLPPPRQYILTNTGKVIIGYPYPSEANAVQSQPVPNGHRVTISYFYQNNDSDDLVKVDYLTREMITINLTARTYDPVNRRPISTTVTNRVRIRNMQR